MGMFTRIIHDDHEYQIKIGWDDLLTYHVGDRIPWQPDPKYPGEHIDGVHDAWGDGCTVWIVIKDCTVIAVEPFDAGDRQTLASKHGITDPDPSLWTEEQWAAKKAREDAAKARYEAWKKEHSTGDAVADSCSYFTHCKLQEPSAMERILPVKKSDD